MADRERDYLTPQIRVLHLAAIGVDRPVHEMMSFAKSLLCPFFRFAAGVSERLEGVLASVDFATISTENLLKEFHVKAAHRNLHSMRNNSGLLKRQFDLPQGCIRECVDVAPAYRLRRKQSTRWAFLIWINDVLCGEMALVVSSRFFSAGDLMNSL
jgi:hypothetical protein